jgi:hypothetical protein
MLPLKLICERKFIRRNGTTLIYIQYCFSAEKRTLLNTEIAIPPQYWNKKKQCITKDLPKSFGEVETLTEDLTKMFRLVEDLILFAQKRRIENLGSFVKNTFHPNLNIKDLEKDEEKIQALSIPKEKKISSEVFVQFDDYIRTKEKKVSRATLSVFNNLKEQLKAFEAFRKKKITFEGFDYNFYDTFVDFFKMSWYPQTISICRYRALVNLPVLNGITVSLVRPGPSHSCWRLREFFQATCGKQAYYPPLGR